MHRERGCGRFFERAESGQTPTRPVIGCGQSQASPYKFQNLDSCGHSTSHTQILLRMANKIRMNSIFCEHLQHDPATQPICSHVGGQFAPFPANLREFPLDVVEELDGYTLATTIKNGVTRFALRTPLGRILEPMGHDRRVKAKIQGTQKCYNVANLLASYVLSEDVTDNEYGILIVEDGLWIESAADRMALCDRLKLECTNLPRVELERIPRPKSNEIDVRGKGYYVDRGVVYQGNGTPISVTKTGHIHLTGATGKSQTVGLGWVLFAAYPDFYGYRQGLHTQMDHINGVSTENEAWNFRPMRPDERINSRQYFQVDRGRRRSSPTTVRNVRLRFARRGPARVYVSGQCGE